MIERGDTQLADKLLVVLTFLTALGCGLNAGVFFAFSSFVMKGLAQLPAPQGIAAMQAINITALTPLFMSVLFGTGALCILVVISSLVRWHQPGSAYLLTGSLVYLAGTIMVTIVCNVPRNNALAATSPTSPEAAAVWASFVTGWTAWNHVRTVSGLIAAALMIFAMMSRSDTA